MQTLGNGDRTRARGSVAMARSDVKCIDRAVAILARFRPDRQQAGVSEIARLTGLTPYTAHRLLASLTKHELLKRVDGGYILGPRILRPAEVAHATLDLQQVALPVRRRLRDETGETVGLHVLRGLSRVVIDQVESLEPLRRRYTGLDEPIPIHQGAPGRFCWHICQSTTVMRSWPHRWSRRRRAPSSMPRRYAPNSTDPALRLQRLAGGACPEHTSRGGTRARSHRHRGGVHQRHGPGQPVSRVQLQEMATAAIRAGKDISAALGHVDLPSAD